jgi:hypothetical protein
LVRPCLARVAHGLSDKLNCFSFFVVDFLESNF